MRALPAEVLRRVRELRQNATDAEQLLWKLLRDRQLAGAKFRRQHPYGRYILDFYCHEAHLAIELDGGGHAEVEQATYDAEQTRELGADGIRVLRFWNNEVLQQTEAVAEAIWQIVAPLEPDSLTQPDTLTPALSQGEREPGNRGETVQPSDAVQPIALLPAGRREGDEGTFRRFVEIGAKLADLHLNYESAPEYPLKWIENKSMPFSWRVEKMKLTKDKDAVIINESLTLAGVPQEAFAYRLGNRSALAWVIDQYQVSTDKRSSITSDPNRADDEEYIVRLVGQVVHVSVETVKLVAALPPLLDEDSL